jgi:hypothetical protein
MKLLLLLVFVVACGGDSKVVYVPTPSIAPETAITPPVFTLDDLLAPGAEQACSSSSDCAGFGKCSGGKCGNCSSSSDCNGHGKCSGGKCGSCSSSSDCKTGKCSSGKCGNCSSSSDCKGGKCDRGRCGNYSID